MKIKIQNLFIALAIFAGIHHAAAQGTTAFTYQGQLHDGGTNANGTYTMTFKLYDAATSGNPIGTNTSSPTLVNGLFSVNLDFGNVFNGNARWLDITVQSGSDTQTLTPRVQVLPTPYAQFAAVAATVTNGAIMNAQIAANAIATTNIQNGAITTTQIAAGAVTNANLTANAVATTNIQNNAITTTQIANGAVTNRNLTANAVNATNIASGQVVKGLNGLSDFVSLLAATNLVLTTNGNVLQISTGSNVVTAIDGNLRIVRGIIDNDGTILYGSGFSVSHSSVGGGGVSIGNYSADGQGNLTANDDVSGRFAGVSWIYINGNFCQVNEVTVTTSIGPPVTTTTTISVSGNTGGGGTVFKNVQLFPVYTVTFTTPFSTPPSVVATPFANDGDDAGGHSGVYGFNSDTHYVTTGLTSVSGALSSFQAVVSRANIENTTGADDGFEFIAIGPK